MKHHRLRAIRAHQAVVFFQGAGYHGRLRTHQEHLPAVNRERREEPRFIVRTVARKLFGIDLESPCHPVDEPLVCINLILQHLGNVALCHAARGYSKIRADRQDNMTNLIWFSLIKDTSLASSTIRDDKAEI